MKLRSVLIAIIAYASSALHADLASDQKTLIGDHAELAFSLFPTLKNEEENLIFSPYSIATCLSMAYLGARGETQTQMQSALNLTLDRKNLAKAAGALSQSLLPQKKDEKSYQLQLANALWIDQETFLLTDFRYPIEEQFKAKLGRINFANSADAATTINDWTSQQTQGKISNLLRESDIDSSTRLVLTSTAYFQGTFQSPFPQNQTKKSSFYSASETSAKANMMRQTLSTPYFENDLMHAFALPFNGATNRGSSLALLIVFPKSPSNFALVLRELMGSYDEWLSSLKSEHIDLSLPKFTFSDRFDLTKPLEDLGMEDAFDAVANFTGIDGMRDLYINKIIHQAYFSVDENGTCAGTATAAPAGAGSAAAQKPTVQLVIDHPFLFFIVDLKSHEMLFMGKVSKLGEA